MKKGDTAVIGCRPMLNDLGETVSLGHYHPFRAHTAETPREVWRDRQKKEGMICRGRTNHPTGRAGGAGSRKSNQDTTRLQFASGGLGGSPSLVMTSHQTQTPKPTTKPPSLCFLRDRSGAQAQLPLAFVNLSGTTAFSPDPRPRLRVPDALEKVIASLRLQAASHGTRMWLHAGGEW